MNILEKLRNKIRYSYNYVHENIEPKEAVENTFIEKDITTERINRLGTYKRILELLPEEALSALPKEVFNILGYGFLGEFKKALIEMRKNGVGYVVCGKLENSNITPFYVDSKGENKNFEVNINPETKEFEYYLDRVRIDKRYVLVFGDERRHENSKLEISEEQKRTVYMYEDALKVFFNKINNSYAWFLKLAGYNDIFAASKTYKEGMNKKIKDIASRKANGIVYLEKEDEINVVQMDLNWFSNFIKEYKIKICLDFNVPYTKLFGESASGLTATGEGDRRSWYDAIKSFQALYIYPNLIKLGILLNKQDKLELINLENIEQEDKQLEAHLQSLELNNVIQAVSNGLIEEDIASKLTRNILGINEKENKTEGVEDVRS